MLTWLRFLLRLVSIGRPTFRTPAGRRGTRPTRSHDRLVLEPLEDRLAFSVGLDPTFGVNGSALLQLPGPCVVTGETVGPKQTTLVSCVVFNPGANGKTVPHACFVRLTSDGRLDTTFHQTGYFLDDSAAVTQVADLAVQPDGSILALEVVEPKAIEAGLSSFSFYGSGPLLRPGPSQGESAPPPSARVEIARYLPDGRLDGSFGKDGRVLAPAGLAHAPTASVNILADGEIELAGLLPSRVGGPLADLEIVRFNGRGERELAFGHNGLVKAVLPRGPGVTPAEAITVKRDGNVVVLGAADAATDVATLDQFFGGGPVFEVGPGGKPGHPRSSPITEIPLSEPAGGSFPPEAWADAIPPGEPGSLDRTLVLYQFTPDGRLDHRFGSHGALKTNIPVSEHSATLTRQPGDELFIDSQPSQGTSGGALALTGITADGQVDTRVGSDGTQTMTLPQAFESAVGMITPDQKLVMAGVQDNEDGTVTLTVSRWLQLVAATDLGIVAATDSGILPAAQPVVPVASPAASPVTLTSAETNASGFQAMDSESHVPWTKQIDHGPTTGPLPPPPLATTTEPIVVPPEEVRAAEVTGSSPVTGSWSVTGPSSVTATTPVIPAVGAGPSVPLREQSAVARPTAEDQPDQLAELVARGAAESFVLSVTGQSVPPAEADDARPGVFLSPPELAEPGAVDPGVRHVQTPFGRDTSAGVMRTGGGGVRSQPELVEDPVAAAFVESKHFYGVVPEDPGPTAPAVARPAGRETASLGPSAAGWLSSLGGLVLLGFRTVREMFPDGGRLIAWLKRRGSGPC